MFINMKQWKARNPPPATIMLISDGVVMMFENLIADLLQETKYNLFLAYSYRPYKMSVLLTSAEWLWKSLLVAGVFFSSPYHHHPLMTLFLSYIITLSVSETRNHVLRKCSQSQRGEPSTKMFSCMLCLCDCKSLEDLRTHLSSEDHAVCVSILLCIII